MCVSQSQQPKSNSTFGLAFSISNLSSHIAKPRRKRSGEKIKVASMFGARQSDCGESETLGNNVFNGFAKASINAVRRSFTASTDMSSSCSVSTSDSTTVSSSDSPASSSQTKRVSFCRQVEVHPTISLEEISDAEYSEAWYSTEEFAEITQSCCKLIHKIDRGDRLKSNDYTRGLETHTHIRALIKQMTRSDAIQAALSEQDRQIRQGIQVADDIAHLYRDASASSQLWASIMGLADQREAENASDDFDELSFVAPTQAVQMELVKTDSSSVAPQCWQRRTSIHSARAA